MIYHLGEKKVELVGKKHFIADSADLIGNVLIHNNVSIWFNAVLRGDLEYIVVGEGSNVQDCCVVHTDERLPAIIGENCTIGHGAIIHGCRIGDTCLVGMNATVLGGARVGENCIIGANSLVPQGMEIPPNSLAVGNPAKVIKELKEGQISYLKKAAGFYLDSMDQYEKLLKEGEPVRSL